jgi:hypothetical protein
MCVRVSFDLSYRTAEPMRCDMSTAGQTVSVSVRLPRPLVEEATELRPESKISEVMVQALSSWVAAARREHEDDLIREALASISPEQKKAEQRLVTEAGKSSLRAMERVDD